MIINADAIQWAKEYEGDPFHAMLCDPPYHLSTTKRYSKENSAPAQDRKGGPYQRASKGFMGKSWDGGDIAFQPETWEAFFNILYPGAFGMAFGGSRTAHRMAVAIEDAGFIIHPQISWVYGSGFPKAHRIKGEEIWEGHRYGLQALKPAQEPIIVFQKPYDGKPLDNIVDTGAGALNVDGGRIGGTVTTNPLNRNAKGFDSNGLIQGKIKDGNKLSSGRWPANFLLTHSPGCQVIGHTDSEPYQINRFTDGAKPFGDGAGHEFESEEIPGGQVSIWECVDGCIIRSMGEEKEFFHQSHWAIEMADPFIYQAKASQQERNAGLHHLADQAYGQSGGARQKIEEGESEYLQDGHIGLNKIKIVKNPHPTLKPIALIEHLASLLLPPKEYKPRRIMVPFAGVASEVIGCWKAGWDEITGIELEEEYADIGKARLEYWKSQGIQLNLFEGEK